MTLKEFLERTDCNVSVYSFNQPVHLMPDDPRLNCEVTEFGIVSEFELWVDIDEEVH